MDIGTWEEKGKACVANGVGREGEEGTEVSFGVPEGLFVMTD